MAVTGKAGNRQSEISEAKRRKVSAAVKLAARMEPRWPQVCRRCGYKWKSRRKVPRFCSRCKSKAWQVPTSESPIQATRRRYWLGQARSPHAGKGLAAKGNLVYRVKGRRGFLSAKAMAKRKRDKEGKRAKREQERISGKAA